MGERRKGLEGWCLDCPGRHILLRTADKEVNSLPQGKQTVASNSDSWPPFLLDFFSFSTLEACGILISWPRPEPRPWAVKGLGPHHWTARESRLLAFYIVPTYIQTSFKKDHMFMWSVIQKVALSAKETMEKMTKTNEILSQSSGDDWRQNLKELFRCFKIFKSDTLLCGSYFSWSHCLFHELFFFFWETTGWSEACERLYAACRS